MKTSATAPLALLACLFGPAFAAQPVTVLLDDFENVGYGTKWCIVSFAGKSVKVEIAEIPKGGHDGKGCAQITVGAGSRLEIEHEFGKGFVGNGDKERLILPGNPLKLGLWARGNGSETKVIAEVTGGRIELGTLSYEGWKFLEKELPPAKEKPVRLRGLHFDATKAKEVHNPEILIDDLTVVTQGEKDSPLFIAFERLDLGRQLSDREPFSVRLILQNLLPEPRKLKVDVDVTTAKTITASHAETLRSRPFEAELAPGEAKSWTFDYALPQGMYNGYLAIRDAATGSLIADRRVDYAVLPKGEAASAEGKDFCIYPSGLSPFILVRNNGPRTLLFQGLEPYGLGGPTHAAFAEGRRVRVTPTRQPLGLPGMSEAWVLFWYHGAKGWDQLRPTPYPIDVPILVVLQHKPLAAKPAGTGLELTFPKESGHLAIVPLYGVSFVRASDTARWANGLPPEVARRCRLLAEVSRECPIGVEERFKTDPVQDVVAIRSRFDFLSIDDDWRTPHRKVAPLEPLTALVNRYGWKPLAVQGQVLDLDLPVSQGLFAGVEGADQHVYTLSGLLKYVNLVEQPKALPPDDPLLPEARKNCPGLDIGRNYWWVSVGISRVGQIARYVRQLPPDDPRRIHADLGSRILAAYSLNPNNLTIEYDAKRDCTYALDGLNYNRMGWCDAGPTSNEMLRAVYHYVAATGDRDFLVQRWPLLRSFYHVPVKTSHWGDSAFNSGGGDTFGSNLSGALFFARMAAWAGDEPLHKFASYHVAKQLVAFYGLCAAWPKWVQEKCLWASLLHGDEFVDVQEEGGKLAFAYVDPRDKDRPRSPIAFEDIPFSDLRGGNIGYAPWEIMGWHRTSEPMLRFMKDHLRDYARWFIDGFPRKYRPTWYQAAYVDQAKLPDVKDPNLRGERSPFRGDGWVGPVLNEVRLPEHDGLFDVPLPQRRARLHKFLAANGKLRGREFDVIFAGIEQTYKPIWDGAPSPPKPDAAFQVGIEKLASTAGPTAFAVTIPRFQWPTLAWHLPRSPERPDLNPVGALPFCGIVPDERKVSFAAVEESPNWGTGLWGADYLRKPVLDLSKGLGRLPVLLQSYIIERGLDRADEHVQNMLAQSELEWNIAGPFPYWNETDFDRSFPPEEKIDLAADYGEFDIRGKYRVRWQKAKARMYYVDFNKLFRPNRESYVDNAQLYAALWVKSPDDRDIRIALGSDDGCKVWVNGKLEHKNLVHRGSALDQDIVRTRLRMGWNSVLIKVFNREYGCGWDFYVRFTDDRLLPFGDLRFSAEPPMP